MERLQLKIPKFYKVKKGQTLREIARAFCVAERALVAVNDLTAQPYAGQILRIPTTKGNAYTAREGDTKTLLCGSDETYKKKNGTNELYLGMRVIL